MSRNLKDLSSLFCALIALIGESTEACNQHMAKAQKPEVQADHPSLVLSICPSLPKRRILQLPFTLLLSVYSVAKLAS